MRLYPHGGYLNPGYGAFCIGVTIQYSVALCLLALAAGDHDGPTSVANRPHKIAYTSADFYKAMGGLHLLGGGVTAVVVILGYLVFPFLLCPITLITILNWCLMFTTAGCCGHVLTQVQNLEKMFLQHLRQEVDLGPVRDLDYTERWAYTNQIALMYITCMCVAGAPCYFAGLVYSKESTTGTRATTWFYVSVLMLISGMVVVLMTGLPRYRGVGIIWFLLWMLMTVGIQLQQLRWYRVFAVVLGVIFALTLVYSLAVGIVTADSYAHARKYVVMAPHLDPKKSNWVRFLSASQYSWLKSSFLSEYGQYFMYEVLSCVSLWIMSTFSMLYAIYSVFTKKPPESKKTEEDSGEQGEDADEKVELKQEEPGTADSADQP